MKKKNIFFVVLGIALVIVSFMRVEATDESLRDATYYICYNRVNIRAEPNDTSEIVDQLSLGQKAELTGRYSGYLLGETWYETVDGWITEEALMRESEFEIKFGY